MRKLLAAFPIALLFLVLAVPARAQVGFGSAVAVGEEEVFIGEPRNQQTEGFVYVYRRADDGWKEVAQLSRDDATPGDGFGAALTVEGDLLLVGANRVGVGTVEVFVRDGDGWNRVAGFSADDLAEDAGFGSSLALQGDTALVGAPAAEDGAGAAYVFERSGDTWSQVARLVVEELVQEEQRQEQAEAEGGEEEQAEEEEAAQEEAEQEGEEEVEEGGQQQLPPRFGARVALHDDWAFVSAPNVGQQAGAVYVFRREDGAWNRVAQLPGRGGQEGAAFGAALTFHDGELFVGAPDANGRIGGVYVFSWDAEGEEWERQASLAAFDGRPGLSFGSSIAFDGRDVLVGAPGAARIYRFARDAEGNFTGSTKLAAEGATRRSDFGDALASVGDVLVAGMPGSDYGAGTAVIMDRTDWGWARTEVMSDIKGFDPVTDGPVPCENGTAAGFSCENVDLLSFLPVRMMHGGRGVSTNDLWGWTDPETGKEYALVGMTDQAAFVDVSDPLSPVFVGWLPKTEGAPGSSWRDMKVYENHVFIVSDNAREHGMQVFDLTRLREFDGEPIEFTEDAHYDQVHSVHNIVINEESGFAYAVGSSGGDRTCGGGLHMINIEDPKRPAFAGCFSDPSTGRRGTGYSHDAQCVIYQGPDERYQGKEICFGANETALSVADVTDKQSPVAVSMASYPNVGYTHQGWLTPDHRYFFMNDELDELQDKVEGTRTLVWDVQDLEDPIVVEQYVSENRSSDHNLYIVGNTMYQSNYVSGLRVFSVDDPENPRPVGYFDTVPYGDDAPGFAGSWSNYPFFRSGAIAVNSGDEGLFLVRFRGEN